MVSTTVTVTVTFFVIFSFWFWVIKTESCLCSVQYAMHSRYCSCRLLIIRSVACRPRLLMVCDIHSEYSLVFIRRCLRSPTSSLSSHEPATSSLVIVLRPRFTSNWLRFLRWHQKRPRPLGTSMHCCQNTVADLDRMSRHWHAPCCTLDLPSFLSFIPLCRRRPRPPTLVLVGKNNLSSSEFLPFPASNVHIQCSSHTAGEQSDPSTISRVIS